MRYNDWNAIEDPLQIKNKIYDFYNDWQFSPVLFVPLSGGQNYPVIDSIHVYSHFFLIFIQRSIVQAMEGIWQRVLLMV